MSPVGGCYDAIPAPDQNPLDVMANQFFIVYDEYGVPVTGFGTEARQIGLHPPTQPRIQFPETDLPVVIQCHNVRGHDDSIRVDGPTGAGLLNGAEKGSPIGNAVRDP